MLGAHLYSRRQKKSYYSLVGSECSQTMIIYYLIVWESDIKVICLTIGTNSVFITVKFCKIATKSNQAIWEKKAIHKFSPVFS